MGIAGLLDDFLVVLIVVLHLSAIYRSALLFRHGHQPWLSHLVSNCKSIEWVNQWFYTDLDLNCWLVFWINQRILFFFHSLIGLQIELSPRHGERCSTLRLLVESFYHHHQSLVSLMLGSAKLIMFFHSILLFLHFINFKQLDGLGSVAYWLNPSPTWIM